jgi:hypothetical protein
VHRECRQWQHNVAFGGSISLQPAFGPGDFSASGFASYRRL